MIFVALGANLPGYRDASPLITCCRAAEALERLPGLRFVALSRWYRSAPVPPSGQPPYVNGVAMLEGEIDPVQLLHALQAIELAHGRERSTPNAARTLDLDIVAMGALVRLAPDPVLPHPRMHERSFVLRPLLDVAPGWRHPVLDQTPGELLARLTPQDVHPIPDLPLRDGTLPTN